MMKQNVLEETVIEIIQYAKAKALRRDTAFTQLTSSGARNVLGMLFLLVTGTSREGLLFGCQYGLPGNAYLMLVFGHMFRF